MVSSKSGFRGGRDNAAIQENMELLTGQRGSGLDRAITMRELASLGLINITRNSNGAIIPKPIPPLKPDINLPVDIPHSPVSFAALGGFGAIMLEWEIPTFNGFSYAELWRAIPNTDGSAPSIEQAVLIATTPATVFGDVVDPGSTFYYWCRFVNINDIAGPYNNVDGLKVSTNSNISDIINDIGEQMKASDLIKTLNEKGTEAYQKLWAQKVQAGDITAGIGIIAKEDGTSQVAISASQFFVFDPQKADSHIQPLFAIDNGNVIIPKAFIEKATIQILNAQTIIADSVKAGIEISSPQINGGYITGGWAGFGPGGSYDGYHTYITANGVIYTDNLIASNGIFNGTVNANAGTFNNVLINSNCTVLGTIYANRIVGDTYGLALVNSNSVIGSNRGTWQVATLHVEPEPLEKWLQVSNLTGTMEGNVGEFRWYVEWHKDSHSGPVVYRKEDKVYAHGTGTSRATVSGNCRFRVPANTNARYYCIMYTSEYVNWNFETREVEYTSYVESRYLTA